VPPEATSSAGPALIQAHLTTTGGGSSSDRTPLELDADGDSIPDALDNCSHVQNPD
jgi:hypothetical protein